jgi:hypothetical protein
VSPDIDVTPVVVAPDHHVDPLGYYVWHLTTHPEVYRAFRQAADDYRLPNPGRRVSADMICHVLRYRSGVGVHDDVFAINNVLTPLYARLYLIERPTAVMSIRGSLLDALDDSEQAQLMTVFAPLRETPERAD